MRPYGATPLAGMMADAKTFLREDISKDPANITENFGPAQDPYYAGGCRPQFIIVLSDGEPNLDLRDACAAGNGKCPYQKPHEIAHELATLTSPIKTFAVGFGLAQANGQDCSQLTSSQLLDANGICATATGSLKACCTLARVAYEGGTDKAYFASDLPTLKTALDSVFIHCRCRFHNAYLSDVCRCGRNTSTRQRDGGWIPIQYIVQCCIGTLWTGNMSVNVTFVKTQMEF